MDALAAWLKQIIIVVLLATFIDLLLPNRSMQRYVKLVVSLFILMTILSPVMNLLGSNANMRMLAAAVEGWDLGGAPENAADGAEGKSSAASRSGSIPALSEVLSAGQVLEAKQNEKSLELLALKMESMVKEQIESQYEVSVIQADAALSLDQDRFPVVERLTVVIAGRQADAEQANGTDGEGNWTMEPVKPVEPVDIRIGAEGGAGADVPASAEAVRFPLPEVQRIKSEIAKSLSAQWNIEERKVTVKNA
jgi:stage III sporulation protein AF